MLPLDCATTSQSARWFEGSFPQGMHCCVARRRPFLRALLFNSRNDSLLISDSAIKRPVLTIVVTLALVIFGIVALANLQTDEFPDVNPPIVAIAIPYPGAAPGSVEREVV